MLEYLVTSASRRRLLHALWVKDAVGTVAYLAQQTRVPYSAAHKELRRMSEAGLAETSREHGFATYQARRGHPRAPLLMQLLAAPDVPPLRGLDARARTRVRAQLAALGAPLWPASPRRAASATLEETLANACKLAHGDATVAKVLPYVFWRHRDRIDFRRLHDEVRKRGESQTTGFMLALAGELARVPALSVEAETFRDRRRRSALPFFPESAAGFAKRLAESRTPDLARSWGFLMNMSLDDFSSVFQRFADAPLRG